MSGIQLKRTKSVKYLGVFIDEDLTWQDHIHYINNKLIKFCSIYILQTEKHLTITNLKKIIFCSCSSSPCI